MKHAPLRFRSEQEAVTYLSLMGFEIVGKEIGFRGIAMATHRTLYAIDELCRNNGYDYIGRLGSRKSGEDTSWSKAAADPESFTP